VAKRPSIPVNPDLLVVVRSGDRRASLEAVRDKLAELLVDASDRTAAGLAQRLVAVIAELDALPGGREVSKLDRIAAGVTDDLALRRATRRTGAAGP